MWAKRLRTTISDKAAPCPLDRVTRQFQVRQPNLLWVADFTSVSTWASFVYVASVIDAFARRKLASSSMRSNKLSASAGRFIMVALSTIATVAANTCRSDIQSTWQRQG